MSDYISSHSGPDFDNAITSVQNGTCGIQGVKVNGVELKPDSSNKVDITLDTISQGVFVPKLKGLVESGTAIDPTYSAYYANGNYFKIGNLCYVTFHIKANITSQGSPFIAVGNLPFNADSTDEQALAVNELGYTGGTYSPTVTCHTMPGSNIVVFERNNGLSAIPSVVTTEFWIGASGCYIIGDN